MLGFFFPTLPLDTWEKAWTESRMQWLASQFGIDRLLDAPVLLPTDSVFPSTFTGTSDEARQVMDSLGERMRVDTSKLRLEVCADEQLPNAVGHDDDCGERRVIRLSESQLHDPEAMVATLAHELSHELLLGGGLLTKETVDHEWITDLLPVFLGVGLFGANATVREHTARAGHFYGSSMGSQGYLRSTILGYALALFTWVRDDPNPTWAKYLRLDAASGLRSGIRYLRRTNDSLFQLSTVQHSRDAFSINELIRDLAAKRPTRRIAALWELAKRGDEAASAAELIVPCLRDRDRGVRYEAANTFAAIGPAAEPYAARLCTALRDPDSHVRRCAASTLGLLATSPETVVPELAELLADDVPDVVSHASAALAQFKEFAAPAIPELLQALRLACIKCRHDNATVLVWALDQISSEADSHISEFFPSSETEFAEYALELLSECRSTET
ncbi:MAG: hypothetical protein CMJ64_29190 [Planctomycetaceae bacterium]|jgi:hypothetical protein|nr:hypothetical protein [Planctomycetaceae bacterium]